MSNNLSGFSSTFLIWDVEAVSAQLDALLTPPVSKPTPLDAFSTKFSNIPAPSGILNIPVVSYPSQSFDLSGGMVTADANSTNYPLTVNRDTGMFYPFSPAEAQQYGLENFVKSFLAPSTYAIDNTLNSASFALLQSFNTASIKPATAANMTVSSSIALNALLSNAGINGERILVLNSSYFWNGLVQDLSNKNNSAGASAIISGNPSNPLGMATVEAQLLPTVGNLVGFTGNKSAIVIGTAIPNCPHANGTTFVYSSPAGGSYLMEYFYDEHARKWFVGSSVLYNVAAVNQAILRIVSA